MTARSGFLSRVKLPRRLTLSGHSDLLLAFLIVSVIALMILPLPLLLIDILVAANITLGVMLVLMAIYVSSPLQFSSFPAVLLISTLFRLALSVATTRMILLGGDAGNIIDTFGQLVAGGNLVVGLVVFLIITIVQFLVIAKGSERVAEVGARFTLDAMPGKQLSIDSDLRSGLIDKVEARRKRSELEKESQLHGSLDGAMKFVKGDAIAGIVIIIVNLLGGLAIGVFQVGMGAGEAMAKYSILTVGDGLVAQIPALFGAMAAGLIVTRVGGSDPDENLGDAIQNQFTAIPRVLMIAGGMCMAFSLVPGFPSGVFVALGLCLLFGGAMLVPAFKIAMDGVSGPAFDSVMQRRARTHVSRVAATETPEVPQARPLVLSVPAEAALGGGDVRLRDTLQASLQDHHDDSAVRLPKLHFVWHREPHRRWSLRVLDVPVHGGEYGGPDDLPDIAEGALSAIRRNVGRFMGIEQTSKVLVQLSDAHPELVREIQRALPLQGIAVILGKLVEEEVPMRNLTVALEGMLQASLNDKDLVNLTEYARIALGRQICNRYAEGGVLAAVALSLDAEETLLGSLRASGGVQELGAHPEFLERLGGRLDEAIAQHAPSVLVTPVVLRRHLRALIADRHFDIAVLSYPEIVAPFTLDLRARVDPGPVADEPAHVTDDAA